jgi:hypothetical protein
MMTAAARQDEAVGLASLTRIDVLLPLEADPSLRAEPFIEVFGRWRVDESRVSRLGLNDLADYAHLPSGPKALMIADGFHLGVTWEQDGPAVIYSHRGPLEGDLSARFGRVIDTARALAGELLAEPAVPEAARRIVEGALTVILNDRERAPNTPAVREQAAAALAPVLDARLGAGAWIAGTDDDPRRRTTFRVSPKVK